ncbi:MAG: class I SAM-dependent methyltransferase [Bacteriovorax sp.]|nr:class I SAM-dependent methyltransferase [Bacteriovorax sp.]
MRKILENSIVVSNLAKTILYSTEYRIMNQLSKSFSLFVKPPYQENDKDLVKYLREGVLKLHQEDAKNIADGFYPIGVIKPKGPKEHLKNLPYLLIDSLKISRRRKFNIKKDFDIEPEDAPDYLKRNYHFQTDGYFSEQSAKIYEHQVEVLFSGTAGPMRRMLIKMIKEKISRDRPLKILELGAGVGSATLDYAKAFDFSSYTVSDVSGPYLKAAKERFNNPKMEFVQTAAESLPFADEEFDMVFSVYLFHELPQAIREKVLAESYRVLKKKGILGICDSLQKNDVPKLNRVLENFPIDYHEPFYKGYTIWNLNSALNAIGFRNVESQFKLLSKYWVAEK